MHVRLGLSNPGVPSAPPPADTTAPVLSSPVGTKTGSATATIGATTDEGNGTMYAVVTTSASAPTATQVEAGQNNSGTAAVFAGSTSVASTGAKTISATGLSAGTAYYAHIMHKDAAGNRSSVVSSAQFTTDAGAVTAQLVSADGIDKSSHVAVSGTPRLTSAGETFYGAFAGVRADTSFTDKRCYEVTLDAKWTADDNNPTLVGFDYSPYADLSATISPPGVAAGSGFGWQLDNTGIWFQGNGSPQDGTWTADAPANADIYHAQLDPATGAATLYRVRGGSTTTVQAVTGLATGKTWKPVVGHWKSTQTTANFGNNPPARAASSGYKFVGEA